MWKVLLTHRKQADIEVLDDLNFYGQPSMLACFPKRLKRISNYFGGDPRLYTIHCRSVRIFVDRWEESNSPSESWKKWCKIWLKIGMWDCLAPITNSCGCAVSVISRDGGKMIFFFPIYAIRDVFFLKISTMCSAPEFGCSSFVPASLFNLPTARWSLFHTSFAQSCPIQTRA